MEFAMKESKSGSTPVKHRLVVSTDVICDILDVDELGLDYNHLCVTLGEFVEQKASEKEKVVIDAYKQEDEHFLVHLTGEMEDSEYTFASVSGSELAKVLGKKESDLKSAMNEKVFEKDGILSIYIDLPHPATLKNLIDKGGKVDLASMLDCRG